MADGDKAEESQKAGLNVPDKSDIDKPDIAEANLADKADIDMAYIDVSDKADVDISDKTSVDISGKTDVDMSDKADADADIDLSLSGITDENLSDKTEKNPPVKSGLVLSGIVDETLLDETDDDLLGLTDSELVTDKTEVSASQEPVTGNTHPEFRARTEEGTSEKADDKQMIDVLAGVARTNHAANQSPASIRRKKKDNPDQKDGATSDSVDANKLGGKLIKAGSKRSSTGKYWP
jgi:hypothetical protein